MEISREFPKMTLKIITFLLWRTQFLLMIRGCGLEDHLDGSQPILQRFLGENQVNLFYQNWVRQDQIVLRWIVASTSESVLRQIVGIETSRAAWENWSRRMLWHRSQISVN